MAAFIYTYQNGMVATLDINLQTNPQTPLDPSFILSVLLCSHGSAATPTYTYSNGLLTLTIPDSIVYSPDLYLVIGTELSRLRYAKFINLRSAVNGVVDLGEILIPTDSLENPSIVSDNTQAPDTRIDGETPTRETPEWTINGQHS